MASAARPKTNTFLAFAWMASDHKCARHLEVLWTMEISLADLVTLLHGMVFGTLFMLAFSGAIRVIYATRSPARAGNPRGDSLMFRFYLVSMAVPGMADRDFRRLFRKYPGTGPSRHPEPPILTGYPQRLLQSNPLTVGWHGLRHGVEGTRFLARTDRDDNVDLCLHQVWPHLAALSTTAATRSSASPWLPFFATAVAGLVWWPS